MVGTHFDTDILIVGGGPVGLFLANECARRGIRHRLVEAREAQSQHSKALAVMPRTMEIFDMAGIAPPFLEAANRVTSIAMVHPSRTMAQMHFAPDNTPYPFVAMVPQDVTERLLVEELRRKGGDVDYRTSLVSAVQHEDHISAVVEHDGKKRELKTAYVIGCDGAHSAVRHLLDLQFLGEAYDASFMLADMETNEALPADEMQLCPSASGPLAIFPMSATRRRLVATVAKHRDEEPSLETVRQLLAERGPSNIEARSIHWSSYFRVHHRQATRLRVGRMFIAGDAAHIHSPIGGQGMNTGLADVWNLAWKLDLAVRGRASPLLIDSYNAERTPIIRKVIGMTHLMTEALGTPSKLAQGARDLALPLLFHLPPFRRLMVQRLSQLGVSYSDSPIVTNAGERYFDGSLRGGHGICSKFLLILGKDSEQATNDAAHVLASDKGDVLELRTNAEHGAKLIRPDGYLGYAASTADPEAIAAIRALLDRMTINPPVRSGLEVARKKL